MSFALPMLLLAAVCGLMSVRHLLVMVDADLRFKQPQRVEFLPGSPVHALEGEELRVRGGALWHTDHLLDQNARYTLRYLFGFAFGAYVIWTATLRVVVRQREGIPGSPVRDLCISMWTSCCCLSLCQLARHERLFGGRYGILSPTGEKLGTRVAAMEMGGV